MLNISFIVAKITIISNKVSIFATAKPNDIITNAILCLTKLIHIV